MLIIFLLLMTFSLPHIEMFEIRTVTLENMSDKQAYEWFGWVIAKEEPRMKINILGEL